MRRPLTDVSQRSARNYCTPHIEARACLDVFRRFNLSATVQIGRGVTMAEQFHNRILFTELRHQITQSILLRFRTGISRLTVSIQPADIADTDTVFVVRQTGETFRITVRPVD